MLRLLSHNPAESYWFEAGISSGFWEKINKKKEIKGKKKKTSGTLYKKVLDIHILIATSIFKDQCWRLRDFTASVTPNSAPGQKLQQSITLTVALNKRTQRAVLGCTTQMRIYCISA